MREPLLFVCIREAPAVGPRFVAIESPAGPVFMAFASRDLASIFARFYGMAAGAFLLPEPQVTKQLVGSLTFHRLVIFRTVADYTGATSNDPGFPWPDRTVLYDFAAALRTAAQ